MAISKSVRTSCAHAEYHRVTNMRVNWPALQVAFTVASYVDKTFRDDPNGGCVASHEIVAAGVFTEQHRDAARAAFGIAPEHTLLSLSIMFNNGIAFCTAALERSVMGQSVNWEEQYPGTPLADLPTDYLAMLYPIVTEQMFPDGEEV